MRKTACETGAERIPKFSGARETSNDMRNIGYHARLADCLYYQRSLSSLSYGEIVNPASIGALK